METSAAAWPGLRISSVPAEATSDGVMPEVVKAAIGVLLGLGIVAGMYLEADLITVASAGGAFLLAIAWPTAGIVTLAFMAPLKPPLAIPPPGFNTIMVAMLVLGGIIRLAVERPRIRLPLALAIAIGFVLYAFIQQLPDMLTGYQTDRAHDTGYLFFQLATGLGGVIAVGLVMRGRSPYGLFAGLLLGSLVAALLAIVTADGVQTSRLENLLAPSDIDERATGPFGNPNAFGQLIGYAMILALGLVITARRPGVRLSLVAIMVVLGYALAISLSRGASAALLAGIIALAFARGGRRTGTIVMAVSLGLGLVVYPAFVSWRLTQLEGSADIAAYQELASSDSSRFEAVSAAPAIMAMEPVFGVGFGNYRYYSALVSENGLAKVAHNWYGTVLAEQGAVGLAAWLLMVGVTFRMLRRAPSRASVVGLGSLVALAVGSFFLQPPTAFQISFLPVAVIVCGIVADWTKPRQLVSRFAPTAPPFGPARLPTPLFGPRTPAAVGSEAAGGGAPSGS